ncbi:MAG TPA: NAD(+)/NADH kinase [Solirubrobacteraceae bacterium]|jgi:NAD+ kinase|nr:NAD(+)/NADH kinase [Solirubrobacteraceae bacterium]
MRQITVFTHRHPEEVAPALAELSSQALAADVTLRFDPEETAKLGLRPAEGIALDAPVERDVELVVALGGDGTILRALHYYAGTGVPVFGINYGEIGFLATVEHDDLPGGVRRALQGEFELLKLPAIAVELPGNGPQHAMNDLAITRKVGDRVAELSYSLDGEEAGSVRCDGLVVATPAGSTGYNLANGGPVMAWGVEGLVVSFIAPHSMTARALVVAPGDRITIRSGARQPLDVALDGRPAGRLEAGGVVHAHFVKDLGTLAQLPGSSFYRRLREKFGRLAS